MGEGVSYNFINSVKGGCGKTTFSILLANWLSGQKPLLLDMDLQGTAMQVLFCGNNDDSEFKYINQAVREGGMNEMEYVHEVPLKNGKSIYVVFADPSVGSKKQYRVSAMSNYTSAIQFQVFRGGLLNLITNINKLGYKNLIFDMPPNYDGFAHAALDCMKQKAGILKSEDKVNLFYLTGMDAAQLYATKLEIIEMLEKSELRFDNLFVVINDNIAHEDSNEIANHRKEISKITINDIMHKLQGDECKKVHLLNMNQNLSYAKHCILGDGLQSADENAIPAESDLIGYWGFDADEEYLTSDALKALTGLICAGGLA